MCKVDLVAGSQTLLDVGRQLILYKQQLRRDLSPLSSYDNLLVLTSEKPYWLCRSVYPWWTLLYAVINNNQTDMEDVREKWASSVEVSRKVPCIRYNSAHSKRRFYLYFINLLFESALLYRIQGTFLLTSTLWLSQESRYGDRPISEPVGTYNSLDQGGCAAHIGMGGVKIEKEPRQWDEYVYRIS